MKDKLQALHDFLADIMGIVSMDAKSTRTFAQIEKSIKEIMELEKKIAKIFKENGHQGESNKELPASKKKFNDLGKIVTAVSFQVL